MRFLSLSTFLLLFFCKKKVIQYYINREAKAMQKKKRGERERERKKAKIMVLIIDKIKHAFFIIISYSAFFLSIFFNLINIIYLNLVKSLINSLFIWCSQHLNWKKLKAAKVKHSSILQNCCKLNQIKSFFFLLSSFRFYFILILSISFSLSLSLSFFLSFFLSKWATKWNIENTSTFAQLRYHLS